MTPAELRMLGQQLYGPKWQPKLADALPISSRTIRYWLSGERKMREVIARRIRSLATEAKRSRP